MSSKSFGINVLMTLVNEAEDMHKGPDIFWRKSIPNINEFRVLRRWNSHSPSVSNVLGGGYFLRWQGKGTIIDPGCSFIKIFRHNTMYSLNDIDMLIATHDHVDHCQDLGTLISLFRQFNKWLVEKSGEVPHIWDMIISYGVADQYTSFLNHQDNRPFIFWRKVLAKSHLQIIGHQDTPGFLQQANKNNLLVNNPYLDAFHQRATLSIIEHYSYEIEVLPAKHKELLGESTAFGLIFTLKRKGNGTTSYRKVCRIVISGDTALCSKPEVVRYYSKADILVLHVGGMEKIGKPYKGDHLCFGGVVSILDTIARKSTNLPKIVVLTEWGYEFGRFGLNGRTQFTRLVADNLNHRRGLTKKFHAAVPDFEGKPSVCPDGKIVILPADINLRIKLPTMEIFAKESNNSGFFNYRNIYAKESGEQIDYLVVQ